MEELCNQIPEQQKASVQDAHGTGEIAHIRVDDLLPGIVLVETKAVALNLVVPADLKMGVASQPKD